MNDACVEWQKRESINLRTIHPSQHYEIETSNLRQTTDACIRKGIQKGDRFVGTWGGFCHSSKTCNAGIGAGSSYGYDISTCIGNERLNNYGVK